MRTLETDVVIVGSGFGAAAPALRLSQAGFRVLLVEKGPHIDPSRDLRQTQDPRYLKRYLKGLAGDRLNLTYAEGLGGASAFYEMVSLRAPSIAFEQTDEHGRRLWPAAVNRGTMDPYYDMAERMLHVEQIPTSEVPRTGLVFAQMMKDLGYTCDRARYAVRGCVGSGFCVSGCLFGAKQSLHVNYLPQAFGAGAAVECDLEALSIRTITEVRETPGEGPLEGIPHRYEVRCRRTDGDRDQTCIRARLVILGGGTVGTAALLLRSRGALRLLSRHVGRNVAFNGSVKAVGMLPDHLPDGDLFIGRTHPGMISYDFLRSHGVTVSAVKALPIQLVSGARLSLPGTDPRHDYWGQPNVDLMKEIRRRMMILYAIGLTPPSASITMSDDEETPRVHLDVEGNLSAYYKRTKQLLESILTRNGCRLVGAEFIDREGAPYPDPHFFTAHQTGSCRMADTPHRGVCDASGAVFHYPGLYVTDGAAIPSSLAVNSSLTILANAERIAAGIVERYRSRAIATVSS